MGKNRDHIEERAQGRTNQLEQINRELANTNEALLAEIAKRKQTEEALRESEQRFASFMLHMPAAAWMKDMQGRFVYANVETERVFSTPLAALLGKTDYDFFPPETARQFGENDCRALSEGGSLQTIEVLRQADGIEHYSIVSKFAVAGPDGKPAYIAGVAFDITELKRTEEALRESQRALSTLMSNLPGMAYRCRNDKDWTMEFVSEGCVELTGYQQADLEENRKISYAQLIHPDDRECVWNDVQAGLREERPFKIVYRISTAAGEEKWVWEQGRGILGPDGELLALEGFITDITELKRLEEDRSRLAAIVENSDDAIITKTLDGFIVYWNKGAEKLYGYTASEITGRHISTLVPADRVDEVPQIIEKIGRGESAEHVETIRVTKDGRLIPVSLAISLIKDTSGKITGASTIAHDITERKRAEQALRESEERFRAIFEQAAVGIAEVGPDRRWLRVNRKLCEIVGYTEEELRDLSTTEITHPDDREATIKQHQLLQEGKLGNYFLEKRFIRKDGSTVWVNLAASAVFDAGGNLKFAIGVLEDITDRKRAEEEIEKLTNTLTEQAFELAAANRQLEAFNYTVAHDLRKPLTVVSGYCQALKELCGNQLNADCQEFLQEAYDGTLRMNHLIDALLNFSRLSHVELCRETVDLSAMAQAVAAELMLAEPGRRVTFLTADGVTADGDADLLRVVLANLLGNAWKYTGTRDEGIIEFGAKEVDGKPVCFVRDNGAGFAVADADKLFTPFQRLPGAEKFKGHGIGLATVERIISRHGGKIWAEGEPGKGATFYFTLAKD